MIARWAIVSLHPSLNHCVATGGALPCFADGAKLFRDHFIGCAVKPRRSGRGYKARMPEAFLGVS
ncbi:MAG TPA: hypothetical protein VND43_04520 [Burkholderiales bacterium]|nr:hypothetical protein [Burkholderiales bacterium]